MVEGGQQLQQGPSLPRHAGDGGRLQVRGEQRVPGLRHGRQGPATAGCG